MTLNTDNRQRLLKALALTTSDNDGEALAAVRSIRRLMERFGETWETLLRAPDPNHQEMDAYERDARRYSQPEQQPVRQARAAPPSGTSISDMFDALRAAGVESDFIDSLKQQYDERGQLTPRQIDALRKWYGRLD